MSDRAPTYHAYVDWYGHGGLVSGVSSWFYNTTSPYTIFKSHSTTYIAPYSIGSLYSSSQLGPIARSFKIVPNVDNTISVWVYTASSFPDVELWLYDETLTLVETVTTSVKDTWVQLTLSPVNIATEETYTVLVQRALSPSVDGIFYVGWSEQRTPLDDVSCDILATRQVPTIKYGRDDARDLDAVSSGTLSLSLNNATSKVTPAVAKRYTPGNTSSDLDGLITPNRQICITAEFQGNTHLLFNGYTEDFIVNASLNDQSVEVSCVDSIARLSDIEVSTELYPSIRTGDAVKALISEAGLYQSFRANVAFGSSWAEINYAVDSGATLLSWWTYSGDVKTALDDLLTQEGPPSIYTIGASNEIVFKDRLHRMRPEYSDITEIELVGCDTPGSYTVQEDSLPNYGFTDVINSIEGSYQSRSVGDEYVDVWTYPQDVVWGADSVTTGDDADYRHFTGTVEEGYYDAQDLVEGTLQYVQNVGADETDLISGVSPEDHDYVLLSGSVAQVDDTDRPFKRSGTKVSFYFQHTGTVGTPSKMGDVKLRARQIESEEVNFVKEDATSIDTHGLKKTLEFDVETSSGPDAEAVADIILADRANRRPTITAVLKNIDADHMAAILNLDISDPVHVNVAQWYIDDHFTVESIEHEPGELGEDHVVTLYLEQVPPTSITSPFIIGSSLIDGTDQIVY